MTTIEWTEKTWNPITGCTKVSPGCAHCYAADIAKRFWGDRPFTDVRFHSERLEEPLKRRKPTMYFVNSMSDLFHESVTNEQLDQVFAVMALTPQHTYQVLTKRSRRMMDYCRDRLDLRRLLKAVDVPMPSGAYTIKLPLPNVWLGVTVEDQKRADERIPLLLQTPAAGRFLSCEPLLEQVDLTRIDWNSTGRDAFIDSLSGKVAVPFTVLNHFKPLDWVIVGGESGPKARLFNIEWGRSLIEQCKNAGVPVFMKQLGSKPVHQCFGCQSCEFQRNHHLPLSLAGKGNDMLFWPEDLRVREMPKLEVSA